VATYVALLRAVNLGSHNKVSMAALCELLAGLGLTAPCSLLQSGNLVFGAEGRSTADLEALLEGSAKKKLGLETQFFVRTVSEWRAIVAKNPFVDEAKSDPAHLLVFVTRDPVSAKGVEALREAIPGRELVSAAKGKHAYLVYPDGIGRSRVTNVVIEKRLGTTGTGRNWNTVLKVAALLDR
jgi:uncharacterized protein (DUF1697 family)